MDLREIGFEDAGWIHLVQNRVQWWILINTIMQHWVPNKAGNLTSQATISFSRTLLHAVCCAA
jgi:hypothetical protein